MSCVLARAMLKVSEELIRVAESLAAHNNYPERPLNSANSYLKKPIAVDAVQWDGLEIPPEVARWGVDADVEVWIAYGDGSRPMLCLGRWGDPPPHASKGDYIIRGAQGEIYPCKLDTFLLDYEQIN
jgi:hypothetical protein